jgi:HK97 family phage major capsid protein
LRLATRQPMPTGVETIPVVAVAPQAGWVSAGGRKPITKVEWSSEVLKAEEIAAVAAIPDVYISDTSGSWNPEESTENELAKAVGQALDRAVLWGTDAPTSFPSGGIAAMAGGPVSGGDALTAISEAMGELEGEGIVPDGVAASASIGGALRAAYIAAGALPGE